MKLPLAPVKNILKEQTEMRVSKDASIELQYAIEKKAEELSQLAKRFAVAGGRNTVLASDVVNAVETDATKQ